MSEKKETSEEFLKSVREGQYNLIMLGGKEQVKKYPFLRLGQSIFNYVNENYPYDVARKTQFEDNIDCFYDDDKIDAFINKVLDRMGY